MWARLRKIDREHLMRLAMYIQLVSTLQTIKVVEIWIGIICDCVWWGCRYRLLCCSRRLRLNLVAHLLLCACLDSLIEVMRNNLDRNKDEEFVVGKVIYKA